MFCRLCLLTKSRVANLARFLPLICYNIVDFVIFLKLFVNIVRYYKLCVKFVFLLSKIDI